MNEHEKIFTLETLIKELIDFSNKTFFKLYYENNEKVRERERVKRLKTFLDIRKDVEDELPEPSFYDFQNIPPALKIKLNL